MRGVQDRARKLHLLTEFSSGRIYKFKLTVFRFLNGLDPFVSFLNYGFQLLFPGLQLGADVSPLGIEIKNLLLESLDLPLFDLVRPCDIQGTGDLRVTFDERRNRRRWNSAGSLVTREREKKCLGETLKLFYWFE